MKSFALLFIISFVTIVSFGQVQFEKGYFLDKNNQKVECFIKNVGWTTNPSEINYKLELSGKVEKGNLSTIKEFGIYDNCKFVNASVKIDRSTKATPGKDQFAPVWKVENLFLQVILEGKADLYCFADRKVTRFFYSVDNGTITPLIYKEITNGLTVLKNTDFRQQLWDKIRVPKATFELIKSVNYTTADLKKYFETYNGVSESTTMK